MLRAPRVLLAVVTVACWGGVPWGTFQFDDFLNVVRDPATVDGAVLLERLQHGLRPLTRLSYFIDAQVAGLRPATFLTTNLLLHLVTVQLVFSLARRRLDPLAALLAALFFAVQPANAEVVAYVSGRSTGLMTPLLLGGLLLHDRGQRVPAYLLFTLACLAKEVALIFPLLLLVWEATRTPIAPAAPTHYGAERGPSHGVSQSEVLFAIGWAALIGAGLFALEGYRQMVSWSLDFRSVGENLLANGRAIPATLSLWLRPWALSADHDFDPTGHFATAVTGLVLLTVAVLAALALRRRQPLLFLAILWPLIALLPTNSLLAKIDLVTEKPLYLAWVGPAIALGAAVAGLMAAARRRLMRRVVVGVTAIVLCALSGAALWRAHLWRDPVLLWEDAVAKAPSSARCWNNLGMAHLVVQDDVEAVAAFRHALQLDPHNELARMNLVTAQTLCGGVCTGGKAQ